MRACIQRVSRARVSVHGKVCGEIQRGMLLLLGIMESDRAEDVPFLAQKVVGLRIFDDAQGKMNLSIQEVGGSILAVSQFTLAADCRKGKRPSFTDAAGPEKGEEFYNQFVACLRNYGLTVETGVFRTMMEVELVNEGPVTIWLDTENLRPKKS